MATGGTAAEPAGRGLHRLAGAAAPWPRPGRGISARPAELAPELRPPKELALDLRPRSGARAGAPLHPGEVAEGALEVCSGELAEGSSAGGGVGAAGEPGVVGGGRDGGLGRRRDIAASRKLETRDGAGGGR